MTLAPGASQVVPINTGAINFAVEGSLNLMAMATSTSNPAIQNAASANLTIPATSGMTAEFSPNTQTLSSPSTATFLLMVHNTGNTEDSYSATIMGANGPVAATLIGLDGSPTQSIPMFILPGLSTGAIELQVDLSAVGTGTVTVEVRSLTRSETATPDAVTILNPCNSATAIAHRRPTGRQGSTLWLPRDADDARPDVQPVTRPGDGGEYPQLPDRRVTWGRIKILRAVYDAAQQTVTLHPAQRLSIHHAYEVTVIGTGLKGLTNAQGQPLDATDGGQPGRGLSSEAHLAGTGARPCVARILDPGAYHPDRSPGEGASKRSRRAQGPSPQRERSPTRSHREADLVSSSPFGPELGPWSVAATGAPGGRARKPGHPSIGTSA